MTRPRTGAILALAVALALAALLFSATRPTQAQGVCFQETGFCISNPAFQNYFDSRGGVSTFGYPISREFLFLGFRVQFFQGHIMQLQPNGSVATMNLLQEGLMPVTRVNGSTFPGEDPELIAAAPSPTQPNYADRVVEFVRQNAPNEFNGQPVRFFDTFLSTVNLATAFPGGGGDQALLPLLNLEIWGVPTSRPLADPNNGGFIYERYQRSIMHYRDVCRCTERILLASWFKTVITGEGLPTDLAEQMVGTRFYHQWAPNAERWLARPAELPNSDLTLAFVPELPGFAAPPAAPGGGTPAATPTPTPNVGAPSVTVQLDDDRIDPGQNVSITVIGRDDQGIDWIEWRGRLADDNDNDDGDVDPVLRERQRFDCDERTECANVWTVAPTQPGDYVIVGRANDTDNQRTESTVELRVREGPTPTPTPTATPAP